MIEIVKRDRADVREAFVEIAREEVGPRYAEAVGMLDAAMAATPISEVCPDCGMTRPGAWACRTCRPTGSVVTFTPEAIEGMDPAMLGELIQDRVRRGARTIRIEALEDVGRRLGWRVVEDEPRPEAPDAD